MPEVGNGFVATVVASDAIYSAGLFNGDHIRPCPKPAPWCGTGSHRARIPPYHVQVIEEPKEAEKGGRALDVEQAVFLKRSVVSGGAVQMDERWYAPLHEPQLLVHEIELHNLGSNEQKVQLKGYAATASDDLNLRPVDQAKLQGVQGAVNGVYAVEGSNKVSEVSGSELTLIAMAANMPPDFITLAGGTTSTIYAFTAVATSLNSTSPTAEALATLQRYTQGGFAKAAALLQEHSAAWLARSASGRLEVEGDLALAQAINSSLYFIRSAVREDWPHGISPGGLASDAYSGHTFWDQETWMYPPILMLEPALAQSMLQYRFDRMGPARAKSANCRPVRETEQKLIAQWQVHGELQPNFINDSMTIQHAYCQQDFQARISDEALLFAWESAATGVDCVYIDEKLGPWGMFEQHLNGDIAFAVRQYWSVTKDRSWLKEVGFPLVNGTASFFAARAVELAGQWHIEDVMGPDEYSYPVRNSGYTNAVARITLAFAAEAAAELGYSGSAYAHFAAVAKGLVIPYAGEVPGRPDLVGGYHPEYDGFPHGSKGKVWYVGSPDCNGLGGCVKQADAILLSFPLGVTSHARTMANDLDFYEDVTDPNGPAMTWSMFAINWIQARDYTRSAKMFPRGYANVRPPFGVWTEYPRTNPLPGAVNFITGAGGFLQSVVFGTSGMRIQTDGLHFDPPPPSATGTGATRFIVHAFHYLGAELRQEVTANAVRYELLGQSARTPPLCVTAEHAEMRPLVLGRSVGFTRGVATIQPCGSQQQYV